jgi:uncharacterized protein YjbI with pentapeptide repeats
MCDSPGSKLFIDILKVLMLPLAIAFIGYVGSKQIANAELEANRKTEINKLVLNLHASDSVEKQRGAIIGLMQFGDESIPSLTASLTDSRIYGNVVDALRTIGKPSVTYIERCIDRGVHDKSVLLNALGDIGLTTSKTVDLLWDHLPMKEGRETNNLNSKYSTIAFISLLKLGKRNQVGEIDAFFVNLDEVDFDREGINNLNEMNFSRINFTQLKLNNVHANGSIFDNSSIGGYFRDSNFSESSFASSNITFADFSRSNFSKAVFKGARLEDVNFFGANLERADFTEAILSNVSFYRANVSNADFRGASYDENAVKAAKNLSLAILH